MAYVRFNRTKHYTFSELLKQIREVERFFKLENKIIKRGKVELILKIKPTELSIEYTIKIVARTNYSKVGIFVISPKVERYENDKKVPHLYLDGSLCLYYPRYHEWKYTDLWAETLIPWASLWLFYYEIWQETGEWLGGGIHGDKIISI